MEAAEGGDCSGNLERGCNVVTMTGQCPLKLMVLEQKSLVRSVQIYSRPGLMERISTFPKRSPSYLWCNFSSRIQSNAQPYVSVVCRPATAAANGTKGGEAVAFLCFYIPVQPSMNGRMLLAMLV